MNSGTSSPEGSCRTKSRLLTAFGIAAALPLAVYALVGGYSRYTADDFCWAGVLRTEGFVDANIHWYTIYSPRYTFTFLVNVAEWVGPAIVPALPVAAIVLWVVILTWTFVQFDVPLLPAVLLAEVAALATLYTAPDLPQSLYWQTGMLTYLLPLILASLLIGWIARGVQTWWAFAVSGLITFLASGLSETYLIPQNVAVTLAFLVALAVGVRRAHLAGALAGGVLGLLVIVVAPATASRVHGTPAELWLTLSVSIATAYFQLVRLVRFFPLILLLCLAVPALLGAGPHRVQARWALVVTVCAAITVPFAYFASFYAQNGNPPARSLIVPGAIMIGACLFLGFALHAWVAAWLPEARRAIVLAAFAVVPIGIAVTTLPDQAVAADYASRFDAEDQQIRAGRDAGLADLTVPPLPSNLGEDFVTTDREYWFNMCVARYYGVNSIAASSAS